MILVTTLKFVVFEMENYNYLNFFAWTQHVEEKCMLRWIDLSIEIFFLETKHQTSTNDTSLEGIL